MTHRSTFRSQPTDLRRQHFGRRPQAIAATRTRIMDLFDPNVVHTVVIFLNIILWGYVTYRGLMILFS